MMSGTSQRLWLASAILVLAATSVPAAHAQVGPGGEYFLAPQGISCNEACGQVGRTCNPFIDTDNTTTLFTDLGVKCVFDNHPWWADNQPCFVSGTSDPNAGKCLGYVDVPKGGVDCDGAYATVQRVCRCTADSGKGAFGTGLSSAAILDTEFEIFSYVMPDGDSYGVMTHFWATAGGGVLDDAIFRYYIDGEKEASIQFTPPLACGVGFGDPQAPWGTKWMGKGAKDGAWFHNFRIPFQRTIRITAQRPSGTVGGFYCIVRGAPNLPLQVGGLPIPSTARMVQTRISKTYQPLDWVNVADIPSGKGVHFMITLSVASGTMNFLEGCLHAYTPYNQSFPGTTLSTGTEDYFDSAWYFNAGEFHFPVSGFTHLNTSDHRVTWSAYRFHEMDPLPFEDGFRLVWRNGDMDDPVSGHKCFTESGGRIVGNPTVSDVVAYGWTYVWDE